MEHALAACGSGDLHVDLRHDSAGRREYSAGPRKTLVFRLPSASSGGTHRKTAALLFPVDYRCGLPAAGNAPGVSGSSDAAGRGAGTSAVANTVAAGALFGGCDLHVVRLRGRNHHAVLPGLETCDGHGGSRRSRAHHLVADLWMARAAWSGHSVPRGVGNRISFRPFRARVLV